MQTPIRIELTHTFTPLQRDSKRWLMRNKRTTHDSFVFGVSKKRVFPADLNRFDATLAAMECRTCLVALFALSTSAIGSRCVSVVFCCALCTADSSTVALALSRLRLSGRVRSHPRRIRTTAGESITQLACRSTTTIVCGRVIDRRVESTSTRGVQRRQRHRVTTVNSNCSSHRRRRSTSPISAQSIAVEDHAEGEQ
jgi:hypothetical protein